jgi:hypothetical protein
LIIAMESGLMRRIPLSHVSSVCLYSSLACPISGVGSLAYSSRLKLVGYCSSKGCAGVVAAAARVDINYYLDERPHWALPHGLLFQTSWAGDGTGTIKWGSELRDAEIPMEMMRCMLAHNK